MDKAEEYIRAKPSGWYKADLTVAVVTVLGVWFTFLGMAYRVALDVSIIALIAGIIVYARKEYYSDKLSKPRRIAAGVIRGVLYAIALSVFAVPFFMKVQSPFLYSVQKAIYGFNFGDMKSTLYFLPDNIPDNAGEYKIKMVPGVLQSADYIQIEFFTSSEQLAEYRNFAQGCRAVKVETDKGWQEYLNEKAGREQTVEQWKFTAPAGGYYASYYICPESGYFLIVW